MTLEHKIKNIVGFDDGVKEEYRFLPLEIHR